MKKIKKDSVSFLFVVSFVFGLLAGIVLPASHMVAMADNSILKVVPKIEKESTVYAGEIFVDGESRMRYLYSSDISNNVIVFEDLKDALTGTVFSSLVPVLEEHADGNGIAVSTEHQSDMDENWVKSSYAAGKYYAGTIENQENGNLYDSNSTYKSNTDAIYDGLKLKDSDNIPCGKRVLATLNVKYDGSKWEDNVRVDTMIINYEAVTVMYTATNITTVTKPAAQTQTRQAEETAVRKEQDPITINKTPAGVKARAKKNKITVSWKKIKKTKKTKKLLYQIKSIQVQCATDPGFENIAANKKVGKKRTKAVFKLNKKTKYYFRVRYEGSDGVSNWSKVKSAKTK